MATVQKLENGNIRLISDGVTTELGSELVEQLQAVIGSPLSDSGTSVLADDHPMWEHFSGGNRHVGQEWHLPADLKGARHLRRYVHEMKCGAFFELLLAEPGKLFTSEEIIAALPDVFGSPNAVAGCLNGFVKPTEDLDRPFPFFWWEGVDGAPSRYAVRPSVAVVFAAAGN